MATTPVVPGRLNIQSGLNCSTLIDDSYNANPQSIKAGIDVLNQFHGEKILILGAMAELGVSSQQLHKEVGMYAKEYGIHKLFVLRHDSNSDAEFYIHGFGAGARIFDSLQTLLNVVKPELGQDVIALVKGSRSSKMERVVAQILAPAPCSQSSAQVVAGDTTRDNVEAGTQTTGKKLC